MNDTIQELDQILEKGSKISDAQIKNAVSISLKSYKNYNISEYILRFPPKFSYSFFEQAVKDISFDEIINLNNFICTNKYYLKNIITSSSSRGFIFSAVLFKYNNKLAKEIFIKSLIDSEKKSTFSDGVIKNFKKYMLDYCGEDLLNTLKNIDWAKPEYSNMFNRFMDCMNQKVTIVKKQDQVNQVNDLLKNIETLNTESFKLYNALTKDIDIIQLYKDKLNDKDNCISKLQLDLVEANTIIETIKLDITNIKDELQNKQKIIDDLNIKLKTSVEMSNISQSQELKTLKVDLAKSLKSDYSHYLNAKDSDFDNDIFIAMKSSLTRIFKTLKRYGIIFNE